MKSVDQEVIGVSCHFGDADVFFLRRYLEGGGFDLDREGSAARLWCIEQARAGLKEAQFAAAQLLLLGLFGKEDKHEALHWCQKSADQGFPAAVTLLASFYESGWGGLEANGQLGVELLSKAANMGHAPAMTALATLHLTGIYMTQDRAAGLQWLRRAADKGDAAGQCMLGGELLKDGDIAGIELIAAAASAGYAPAHTNLGYFYSSGLHGLPRDQKRARHHFEAAEKLEKECSQW